MRVRGYAGGTPCWVELVTPDPAGATAFYGGLLGWSGVDGGPEFRRDGLAVAGLRGSDDPGRPAGWLSYVATDDPAGAVARAEAAGGSVLAPPFEVPGRGEAAVLAHPAGGAVGVWRRRGFAGAQVANEPGAVCWTDLATPDEAAAERFYGAVFGWQRVEADYVPEGYGEWHAAGRPVAGVRAFGPYDPPGVPAYWTVMLMVADCRATAARAGELGGQVLLPPLDMTVGTYAMLADPAGAAFGVVTLSPELAAGLL